MDNIVISRDDFKALASSTRTQIIKLLQERNHTLSELSKKLGLSNPTVKQHLDILEKAVLVQPLDEGRKWKYYSLTRKGKNMLLEQPSNNFIIMLGITTMALALLVFAMLIPPQQQLPGEQGIGKSFAPTQAGTQETQQASQETPQPAGTQQAVNSMMVIALALIAVIEGYLIAKTLDR